MSLDTMNNFMRWSRGMVITATKTRPNDTTAYTAGDIAGGDGDWLFDSLGEANMIYLMSIRFMIDAASVPSGLSTYKLHLYNAATAVPLADNAPQTFLTAEKDKYIATIALDAPTDKGDFLFSRTEAINIPISLVGGKVYGRLETDGAYTPTALVVKKLALIGVGI
jgi:hypothetical protein